jgi:hypothetical protein
MAASSVTGVGPGSADKVNKGSEHMHLSVDHLIGPRVVDAGQATLNGATPSVVNVPFTKTLTSTTGYYAHLTPIGSTTGGAIDLATSQVSTTGFTITGANGSTAVVNWMLVLATNGGAVSPGNPSV